MKLYKYLVIISVAIISTIGFSGCEKKYYEVGANMETFWFTVKANQWDWNNAKGRYEYTLPFNNLDEYMFDEGGISGAVYVWEQKGSNSYEVLKSLSYVQSYYDGENNLIYQETIGFETSLQPNKEICFYIQAHDMSSEDKYLAEYQFKINFVWKQ